jgi:hypothetical protein
MSIHKRGSKWVARWREDGVQRALTFDTKREAIEFDRTMADTRRQARQARSVREALERAQQA